MKRLENTNDRKVRKFYLSTSSKGLDGFRFFLWTVLERNPEGFQTIRNPFERCRLRFPQERSESMRARHLTAPVALSALIVPVMVSHPVQHPVDGHTDKCWRNRRKEAVKENCDLSPRKNNCKRAIACSAFWLWSLVLHGPKQSVFFFKDFKVFFF